MYVYILGFFSVNRMLVFYILYLRLMFCPFGAIKDDKNYVLRQLTETLIYSRGLSRRAQKGTS